MPSVVGFEANRAVTSDLLPFLRIINIVSTEPEIGIVSARVEREKSENFAFGVFGRVVVGICRSRRRIVN
jgi:hypothetical protein